MIVLSITADFFDDWFALFFSELAMSCSIVLGSIFSFLQ